MKNKVRSFREAKGLTQKALAEVAGTSQQQIQRIEAGIQSTKLDLVTKICAALEQPLETVFPVVSKVKAKIKPSAHIVEHEEEFSEAGIDVDRKLWSFRVRLRSGATLDYPVSSSEKSRLWKAMQGSNEWVVFDSEDCRVGINPAHVAFHQFLSELPLSFLREHLSESEFEDMRRKAQLRGLKLDDETPDPSEPIDPKDRRDHIKVYFDGSPAPVQFAIDTEWDAENIDEFEDPENANDVSTQFKHIFELMEIGLEADSSEALVFDADMGDTVFLRASDVAVLEVLHWVVEPMKCGRYYASLDLDERDDQDDEDDEDHEGDSEPEEHVPSAPRHASQTSSPPPPSSHRRTSKPRTRK